LKEKAKRHITLKNEADDHKRFHVFTALKMLLLVFWIVTLRWRQYVSLKHWCLPTSPHGVTIQKTTSKLMAILNKQNKHPQVLFRNTASLHIHQWETFYIWTKKVFQMLATETGRKISASLGWIAVRGEWKMERARGKQDGSCAIASPPSSYHSWPATTCEFVTANDARRYLATSTNVHYTVGNVLTITILLLCLAGHWYSLFSAV
jgi:hypothetical protein